MQNLKNVDLYELLGVSLESSVSEIRSAYRKQALKCHPDKTSDPAAVEKFQLLSEALGILTDDNARVAYNKLWNAKRNRAARHRELDSKRQKLKDDLEKREKKAQEEAYYKNAEKMMEKEIERLRKEGSKILEKEKEKLRKEFENESRQKEDRVNPRLKVKSSSNEKLSESEVRSIFEKYGKLLAVVVGKKGTILLEYNSTQDALNAFKYESTRFQIEWIQGKPTLDDVIGKTNVSAQSRGDDFESVVLAKLRRVEERKRMLAEMEANESEKQS
ncbi:dnaJ subfamily C member 17-like protein [Leptotrombidium deliense]|uniref:DnaJ subfamily C member 17-like protein n=1 Tax=Leptotrombidium deliense TaxID=299467 RepID=A0A443SAK9_9ACAR|nr:dnaJ subfamily C member 17-like protein [Leptotrombidium deliense]